jgi:hypothetical protein
MRSVATNSRCPFVRCNFLLSRSIQTNQQSTRHPWTMTLPTDQITNAVLLTVFPSLCRLDEYLRIHLEPGLEFIQESDPSNYKALMHDTLVGTLGGETSKPFPPNNEPCPDACQDKVNGRDSMLWCDRALHWWSIY